MSDLNFPVDFEEKAKLPPAANFSGYPYRISAGDLMRNFNYAALTAPDGWIEEGSVGSHPGRKLKLPEIPSGDGIFLLGCEGGELKWIETESC